MVWCELCPRPLGPKEIDELLVPPGKAATLLTDSLITGLPIRSEPAQEKWFQVKPTFHIRHSLVFMFEALFGCHGVLILGESPIKWRQRPDMTIAVLSKNMKNITFF